ncbi:MAG: hypothetical protein ACKVOK_14030 [Flavobacteriales bacterium]
MKILAIERNIEGVAWDNAEDILIREAEHVYQLYLSDSLREIFFTENQSAILILEIPDRDRARELLDSLPLVKEGMVRFEVMELRPYSGWDRILKR